MSSKFSEYESEGQVNKLVQKSRDSPFVPIGNEIKENLQMNWSNFVLRNTFSSEIWNWTNFVQVLQLWQQKISVKQYSQIKQLNIIASIKLWICLVRQRWNISFDFLYIFSVSNCTFFRLLAYSDHYVLWHSHNANWMPIRIKNDDIVIFLWSNAISVDINSVTSSIFMVAFPWWGANW